MIVVSDTTPFNYLLQLGVIELLEALYGAVYVPDTVLSELQDAGSPAVVRQWALDPPKWLIVREAPFSIRDPLLQELDPGERDALALALEIRADRVLVDDQEARVVAEQLGLTIAGTLAVIRDGAIAGRLDFDATVARLRQLNFRVTQRLVDQARP